MKRLSPKAIWLFFISYLIRLGIIPVGFGFYLISLLPSQESEVGSAFYSSIFVSIIFNIILWILLSLLWAWLTQHFYRYGLMDNHFKKEAGVLHKRSSSIPYENIQDIKIDRTILSRMLGLAEIRIETASQHSDERIPGLKLADAETLKNELIGRCHNAKK